MYTYIIWDNSLCLRIYTLVYTYIYSGVFKGYIYLNVYRCTQCMLIYTLPVNTAEGGSPNKNV